MRETEKEIRYSPRELSKRFKGKEEPEIEEIEEEREIKRENFKDPLRNTKVKPSRKYYHRKYQYGFEEPKIKDATTLVSDIKKYNVDFPGEEFNKALDKLLKNNTLPIEEKTLKDILMWDILDKKGLLTTERIARILNYNSIWEKPIEDCMCERRYMCVEREGSRIYLPSIPQTAQK